MRVSDQPECVVSVLLPDGEEEVQNSPSPRRGAHSQGRPPEARCGWSSGHRSVFCGKMGDMEQRAWVTAIQNSMLVIAGSLGLCIFPVSLLLALEGCSKTTKKSLICRFAGLRHLQTFGLAFTKDSYWEVFPPFLLPSLPLSLPSFHVVSQFLANSKAT